MYWRLSRVGRSWYRPFANTWIGLPPQERNKLASCAKALQQLETLGLVKLPKLCASNQHMGERTFNSLRAGEPFLRDRGAN